MPKAEPVLGFLCAAIMMLTTSNSWVSVVNAAVELIKGCKVAKTTGRGEAKPCNNQVGLNGEEQKWKMFNQI